MMTGKVNLWIQWSEEKECHLFDIEQSWSVSRLISIIFEKHLFSFPGHIAVSDIKLGKIYKNESKEIVIFKSRQTILELNLRNDETIYIIEPNYLNSLSSNQLQYQDEIKDLSIKIQAASKYIQSKINTSLNYQVTILLGTGTDSALIKDIEDPIYIPFRDIPFFVQTTFHKGNLIFGKLKGTPLILMQGRPHLYEGYSMKEITFPIRVCKALGSKFLFICGASGGINKQFTAGDIVLITDHINLMGDNPLIGPNDDSLGSRWPVMDKAYDPDLIQRTEAIALQKGIATRKGVYVGITGPSQTTASEREYLIKCGGGSSFIS